MTKLFVLVWVAACCRACSPALKALRHQHPVTAMKNDSVWYGRVSVVDASALVDKPCAEGKLTLLIASNLSYKNDQLRLSPAVAKQFAGEFVPRQRLTFANVPPRKGKYTLSGLNECGTGIAKAGPYNYVEMSFGSGLAAGYDPLPRQANWVRITQLDQVRGRLKGTFRLTLADSSGRIVRFRRGRFMADWPRR